MTFFSSIYLDSCNHIIILLFCSLCRRCVAWRVVKKKPRRVIRFWIPPNANKKKSPWRNMRTHLTRAMRSINYHFICLLACFICLPFRLLLILPANRSPTADEERVERFFGTQSKNPVAIVNVDKLKSSRNRFSPLDSSLVSSTPRDPCLINCARFPLMMHVWLMSGRNSAAFDMKCSMNALRMF